MSTVGNCITNEEVGVRQWEHKASELLSADMAVSNISRTSVSQEAVFLEPKANFLS